MSVHSDQVWSIVGTVRVAQKKLCLPHVCRNWNRTMKHHRMAKMNKCAPDEYRVELNEGKIFEKKVDIEL